MKIAPTISEAHVMTGPMTRNDNGTVIKITKNGTIKTLTTSGMICLKNFSIFEPTQIARMIGNTVDR